MEEEVDQTAQRAFDLQLVTGMRSQRLDAPRTAPPRDEICVSWQV